MLFTALFAPFFIDWSSYKKDFERETSRIIGQNVEVLGETKMRLLPLPSITFGGLAVGKNADGSPMMTVDQFAMDIELMPLLRGEVSIVELNLLRPRINLNVDENGAIAWTNRRDLAVDPQQVKLENFTITNGEIKISGLAGGRTLALEQLDGRLSAKSLYGPWRINADGYVGENRARIDITTGQFQDDGSIRVKLSAVQANLPYRILVDGPVQVKDGLLGWDGKYKITALKNDGNRNNPALPIFSEGTFNATPRRVDVPEFRLEIGARDDPYTITGNGFANIGDAVNFRIEADGRQIDLDRLGQANGDAAKDGGLSLEQRLGVLRSIIEKVPVPSAQGIIDLSLPAIVAGNTFIREVSAVISPDGDGWNIRRLNAVFPGNTKFEVSGRVGLRKAFGFDGKMLVASRQPTGLATWLGKRDNPFIRKLRTAGFSADVVISDRLTSLENLELVLDDAVLKGNLQRLAGNGGRPQIVARLGGDKVNLDDLRAIFALVVEDGAQALTNHDMDISLDAGRLTGFDITAENVETKFQINAGSLSIEKLNVADVFGAQISSSGRIDNLINQPNGSFRLAVKSQNPSRLLQFLQSQLSDQVPGIIILGNLAKSPDLASNVDLVVEINARRNSKDSDSGSQGQAVVRGVIGGTRVEVEADFDGKPGNISGARLDIVSTLENASPTLLLRQLGAELLPIDISGPLKISANFAGVPLSGFESFIAAEMSGTNLTARGKIIPIGENAGDATFKLDFGSQDINPLLIMSGMGLSLQTIATDTIPVSFDTDISVKGDKITISSGKGQVKGSRVLVDLNIEKKTASNQRIDGKISATSLPLSLLARLALSTKGNGDLEGNSGWSEVGFGPSILKGLDGDIELNIENSDFGIADRATKLKGQLALLDGTVNLNEFTGNWLGGNFGADLTLGNKAGIGTLNVRYKFDAVDIATLTKAIGSDSFLSGNMNMLGSLEGSGRSAAAIISSLTGSGTVDLEKPRLSGFNTTPLDVLFVAVDQPEFEIQDDNVRPILELVIDDGDIDLPSISIPFIVAAGKMRARNIAINAQKTNMMAAIEIDLAKSRMNSQLSVRFDPGKQWVDGADPQIVMSWEGDIQSPERSIDVQPLSGYLSLRNFEREQRRVDILQASIMEKQRLRRDILVTNARVRFRQRLQEEELRRQRQALLMREEIRLRKLAALRNAKLLAQEKAKREEKIRLAAEAERKRLEEIARREAEEAERKRLAAEAEKKRLEEIARREAEEAERKRLAEEAHAAEKARLAAEEEKQRLAEEARVAEEERLRQENEALEAELAEQKRIEDEAARAERLAVEEKARKVAAAKIRAQARAQERKEAAKLAKTPVAENPDAAQKPLSDGSFAKRLKDFLEGR